MNKGNNSVSVIKGSTYMKGPDIHVGISPFNIAINPQTNKIYVTNFDSSSVSVINGSTDRKETDIPVKEKEPSYIAINQYTNKIYVTDLVAGTVSVIDGSNNRLISNIHVGKYPTVLAINPDNNIIYVGQFRFKHCLCNRWFNR